MHKICTQCTTLWGTHAAFGLGRVCIMLYRGCTGVYRGDLEGWHTRMTYRGELQGWNTRVIYRGDLQGWFTGVTYRSDLQGWPTGVTYRGDLQGWPTKVTYRGELQGWTIGVTYIGDLQGWPTWPTVLTGSLFTHKNFPARCTPPVRTVLYSTLTDCNLLKPLSLLGIHTWVSWELWNWCYSMDFGRPQDFLSFCV